MPIGSKISRLRNRGLLAVLAALALGTIAGTAYGALAGHQHADAASAPHGVPGPHRDASASGKVTYSINARGLTYGRLPTGVSEIAPSALPDLVAAIADNGLSGYVYETDLRGPVPSSPADATQMDQSQTRVINVYEADGSTVIGTFTMAGNGTETVDPTPGS